MDYFSQSRWFQLKKVARYVRLYGPRRTWVKVQGQRHKQRRYETLPASTSPRAGQNVGIIGCGNHAFANIAYDLRQTFGPVIGGCMDVDRHRAASLAQAYGAPYFTDDAAALISQPAISMLYIASNHASHAEYAVAALERGKHVYIEKPHVVSVDQLERLMAAAAGSRGKVFLGFNRPHSKLGLTLREHLQRQPGSAVYNWFVAGHAIDPDHWYFHPREGGRVLGNLCHWTDFLLTLVGPDAFPIRITPTRDERSDCDIAVSYLFGEGTVAAITFSAKGHTFEGVREQLHGHKGDLLFSLNDFQELTVDVVDRKRRFKNWFRDHGHRTNVVTAYRQATSTRGETADERAARLAYVANTAWLFLQTKEALDENRTITIDAFPFCAQRSRALSKVA